MRIGIIHHRVGKTDGVSLEIAKRKEVLEKLGHQVILVSGPQQKGADYVIPELKIPSVLSLEGEKKIVQQLDNIQRKEKVNLWFVHNILSLGRHPLAAKALVLFFDKWQLPVVAIHHDFYWERKELLAQADGRLKRFWEQWLLPQRSYLQNVVINSLAAEELKRRRGIKAIVFPDVFDFQASLGSKKDATYIKRYLKITDSLVILQATRIVPRKAIELGLSFTALLQEKINRKVVFLLGNYLDRAVAGSEDYYQQLVSYALKLGIEMIYLPQALGSNFSFWTNYYLADIVSYPSIWEGYGNQFLEAVFFQKPIVMFEYPVFRRDIKPLGYKIISLGNRAKIMENGLRKVSKVKLEHAVKTYLIWQRNGLIGRIGEYNHHLAEKYNSYQLLKEHLLSLIQKTTRLSHSELSS